MRSSLLRHPVMVALAGTLAMAAGVGVGRFAYTPLLPSMVETLGWSVAQAGDVASANFIGYLAGALVAAGLARRPGRRHWLLLGMLASAVTTGVGFAITSFTLWLVVRFFNGLAGAFCLVLSTAVVVEYIAARGVSGLGALHFSGVGAGMFASVAVIEATRALGGDVFRQWGVLGLVCAALLCVSFVVLRALPGARRPPSESSPAASKPSTARCAAIPVRVSLARLILAYGLFGFGYVVTATFIVAIARDLDGSPALEAVTWAVTGLVAAASVHFWQRVAAVRGLIATLRIMYALEIVGVLLAGFGSGPVTVVLGGALLGGTFMGITALGIMAGRAVAGTAQAQVIGWMTASFGVGQLLGPAIAGRLAVLTGGYAAPSAVAAALLLIGLVLLLETRAEPRTNP